MYISSDVPALVRAKGISRTLDKRGEDFPALAVAGGLLPKRDRIVGVLPKLTVGGSSFISRTGSMALMSPLRAASRIAARVFAHPLGQERKDRCGFPVFLSCRAKRAPPGAGAHGRDSQRGARDTPAALRRRFITLDLAGKSGRRKEDRDALCRGTYCVVRLSVNSPCWMRRERRSAIFATASSP